MIKVKYMKVATISIKGQITIPKSIQVTLKLKPKSKVMVIIEDGMVLLKPLKTSIVEQTAGSLAKYVKADKKGKDFETIMKETKKKVSRRLAETL